MVTALFGLIAVILYRVIEGTGLVTDVPAHTCCFDDTRLERLGSPSVALKSLAAWVEIKKIIKKNPS